MTVGNTSYAAVAAVLALVILDHLAAQTPELPGARLAKAVQAKIEEVGPKAALAELYKAESTWAEFRRYVASGDERWLQMAVTLYPVSDAGPRSEIALSVGEALASKPAGVLTLVGQGKFSLLDVCDGPDIDDARFDGLSLALDETERRKKAVMMVSDPALKPDRDRCLQLLEESKAHTRRFYGRQ